MLLYAPSQRTEFRVIVAQNCTRTGEGLKAHMTVTNSNKGLISCYYLVQVKSRQEQRAKLNLQQQNFEVFLPLVSKHLNVTTEPTRTSSLIPLFPGYLFIRPIGLEADLSKIRSTRGVIKLVRFGSHTSEIHADIIDSIKSRLDEYQHRIEKHNRFKVGQRVRILRGPFAQLEATLDQICRPVANTTEAELRSFVLIELLGKLQRVQIEFNALEKVA